MWPAVTNTDRGANSVAAGDQPAPRRGERDLVDGAVEHERERHVVKSARRMDRLSDPDRDLTGSEAGLCRDRHEVRHRTTALLRFLQGFGRMTTLRLEDDRVATIDDSGRGRN